MTFSSRPLGVLVASLMALSFVAGAGVGVAGDRLLAPRIGLRATLDDMSAVFDRLALTPTQRTMAEAIVARTTPRSQQIMIEVADRLRAVSDSLDAELRAILTPAQRLRLDSLRQEPQFMLRRKVTTPRGTTVDTLLDTSKRARPPQ